MIAVLLCLVLSVFLGVYLYFKWRYLYWKRAGIPYLEPTFPFGNLKNLVSESELMDHVDELYRLYKNTAPFGGMFIIESLRVVIFDKELLKHVLIKDFSVFHDRGLYANEKVDPLSGHLVLMEGQKWRALRNKLSPTFTSGKMKFMFPTMVRVGEEFSSTLASLVDHQREVEVKDLIARYATDVIGTCAFGIQCNSLKDPNAEFRVYGRKIFTEPVDGPLGFTLRSTYESFSKLRKSRNFSEEVTKFFLRVVEETVNYREENNVRMNDFLDILIQLKNKKETDPETDETVRGLTLDEIAAQVFVFFLAGFETSSTTMAFTLYEVAINQEIQERVRREAQDVLEKHNGEFTYEAVQEMNYLDQVINETLRKYPAIPIIPRKTGEDYQVPNTEKVIERGTKIFIPVRAIHHDPDYYPNPEVFDPDRFSPENSKSRDPMLFLPFGDGPRNCIGMRFGHMQMRIGLAYLLLNFKFEYTANKPPKTTVINLFNQIDGGLFLKVSKIKNY